MSHSTYNGSIYHCTSGDVYIIRPYDPHHLHRPLILHDNHDLTFALQKYRYDYDQQIYTPLFRRPICLNFHIETYDPEYIDHALLPARLQGKLRLPLPTESTIDARLDTFIRALNERSSLTVYYDPKLHHGCLIHPSCKLDRIDADQLRQIFLQGKANVFTKPALTSGPDTNSTPHTP